MNCTVVAATVAICCGTAFAGNVQGPQARGDPFAGLFVGALNARDHDVYGPGAPSLHETRAGKNFWYGAENGGFERFTNVPIEDIGCVQCHGQTNADGDPYPDDWVPGSCNDCHRTSDWVVEQAQCYSCHGRQKTEAQTLGYSDVHRDMGFVCADCHKNDALGVDDVHGNGIEYDSMLEPGAIAASCEGCHTTTPDGHGAYDPHDGAVHCSACHTQTVISCYNCHFESQLEAHVKRAKQPLHDFIMLVNRDEDGKVYPASFQSITYQGSAFVAMAPFAGHSTTDVGRSCPDCHYNMGGQNVAIGAYNTTGIMQFADWDDDAKVLSWMHGVVPIPRDYKATLRMDFITYDGDPSDPPGPSTNWSSIGKSTWDGHQLFFATPLTVEQMEALGFDPQCVSDVDDDGTVDTVDLLALLGEWGASDNPSADFNGDGLVSTNDLLIMLDLWGDCP